MDSSSSSSSSVPVGRAEHLLLEVCTVDASRTLLGAAAPRFLRQRGGRGHEGDLRLHGSPVCGAGYYFYYFCNIIIIIICLSVLLLLLNYYC